MIPLMKSTFLHEYDTKAALSEFLLKADKLSMDQMCSRFEQEFAQAQDCKFAVLYNSGSSANLALIQSLKNLGHLKDGDDVGFSALTWSTNTMPLIQLGLNPVPIDCSPESLNVMSETLLLRLEEVQLQALFLTNALGFVGDIGTIRDLCKGKGILLIEDNCEALGTETGQGKAGNFGLGSTFSFFVAHHLSTIEGGMVCTDDPELAQMLQIVRANGWDRNLTAAQQVKLRRQHKVFPNSRPSIRFTI